MAKNNEPKPEKEKKPKKPPVKKNKAGQDVSLPLFAEVLFSFSTMFLLLVTLVIVLVSFMSGATLAEIFLRAVVGVVALGSVMWFLTYQVSASLVTSRLDERTSRQETSAAHAQAGVPMGEAMTNQPKSSESKE